MAEQVNGVEPHGADGEIDLRELFGLLFDHWRSIAAITATAVFLAVVYGFAATPIYRTNALVQVEPTDTGLGGIEELSLMLTGEMPTEAEIEIIRSRLVLTEAIERERLNVEVRPRYFPLIGGMLARRHEEEREGVADARLGIDQFAWGGERVRIEHLEVPRSLEGERLNLVAGESGQYTLYGPDGERLLNGHAGVSAEGGGVAIFVSKLLARPHTQFNITSYHSLEVLQQLSRQLSVTERGRQSGIIELALEGPDPAKIAATLDTIANVYVRQNVERRSEEAARTLEFLNEQLPTLKAQLDAAEQALNHYRTTKGSVNLDLETQGMLEQLTEIERQLSELALQRVERAQRFKPEHPVMRAIMQQQQEIEHVRSDLDRHIRDLPQAQQEALRLMRDVRVADELYVLLLNRAQELRVVRAGTIGNVRIVDTAFEPREPVKPRKAFALAVGLALGTVIGIFAVVLRHALDSAIRDPKLLEQHFGLPVYAIVPRSQAEMRSSRNKSSSLAQIIALEDTHEPAVESLRSLRTSVEFLFKESANRVLAITSAQPAAGKSFVTANLGVLIAQIGRRVVIVDADLRRGHLHHRFAMRRGPGLVELITGEIELDAAVCPAGTENLFLLPGGRLPPNPAELLVSRRFEEVLAALAERYDVVLLDAPPVLAASEAANLARLASVNLLVVRSGEQNRREVELAVDRMAQAGVRPRGFIFNDLVASVRRYAYAGYRYYRYEPNARLHRSI